MHHFWPHNFDIITIPRLFDLLKETSNALPLLKTLAGDMIASCVVSDNYWQDDQTTVHCQIESASASLAYCQSAEELEAAITAATALLAEIPTSEVQLKNI